MTQRDYSCLRGKPCLQPHLCDHPACVDPDLPTPECWPRIRKIIIVKPTATGHAAVKKQKNG
jgi:hypothetical protein